MVQDAARTASRVVGGVLLLILGTVFLMQNFGVLHAGRLGNYWPLLLVWVGLARLLSPRGRHRFASGAVILALGIAFQLDRLGVVWLHARDFWPLLLVVAGLALVAESFINRSAPNGSLDGSSSTGVGAGRSNGS